MSSQSSGPGERHPGRDRPAVERPAPHTTWSRGRRGAGPTPPSTTTHSGRASRFAKSRLAIEAMRKPRADPQQAPLAAVQEVAPQKSITAAAVEATRARNMVDGSIGSPMARIAASPRSGGCDYPGMAVAPSLTVQVKSTDWWALALGGLAGRGLPLLSMSAHLGYDASWTKGSSREARTS